MRKIAMLSLALILAMGSLGVGYAMWFDTVIVSGPVTTGSVDVCIDDVSSNEKGTGPDQGNADPQWGIGNNEEEKDVAWLTYEITDCDEATITLHEAYPYYRAIVHFSVCNIGTIPIRGQDLIVTNNNETAIEVNAWDGAQIEPGECNDFTFEVKVLQTADQGASYSFTVQVKYVQWNEYQ